jgi:Cu/Zn superoxide dismutase
MTVHRLAHIIAAALWMMSFSLSASAQLAKATLKNVNGDNVGGVNLVQTTHGVLIRLVVKGLPAGEHAVHVHTVSFEIPSWRKLQLATNAVPEMLPSNVPLNGTRSIRAPIRIQARAHADNKASPVR